MSFVGGKIVGRVSLSDPTHRLREDQDFKGVCLRHRADAHKRARLDVRKRRLDDADSNCVVYERDLEPHRRVT